ncbi:hypothetical protein [Marinobacter lipolyticus]|uniref:hypothetical protein n=1 Tax=Marinobacter lipolyticus TaxID=209639 RepID=UPI003A905171
MTYDSTFDQTRLGQPNASQGVIHVDGQALSIEWLEKSEVEALRNGRALLYSYWANVGC